MWLLKISKLNMALAVRPLSAHLCCGLPLLTPRVTSYVSKACDSQMGESTEPAGDSKGTDG